MITQRFSYFVHKAIELTFLFRDVLLKHHVNNIGSWDLYLRIFSSTRFCGSSTLNRRADQRTQSQAVI